MFSVICFRNNRRCGVYCVHTVLDEMWVERGVRAVKWFKHLCCHRDMDIIKAKWRRRHRAAECSSLWISTSVNKRAVQKLLSWCHTLAHSPKTISSLCGKFWHLWFDLTSLFVVYLWNWIVYHYVLTSFNHLAIAFII